MSEFFIVYNDAVILNRLSEFPATLVGLDWNAYFYDNLIVKWLQKRRYAVYCHSAVCDRWRHENQTGDRITSRRSVPSPCSDLSTNKSMSLTIGYIGEVC